MDKATNPARLLHAHIQCLYKSKGYDKPVTEVVGGCLGSEENDAVSIRRALTRLDQLFEEVERKIRSIPDVNHEVYIRHFPTLMQGFANLNLRVKANQVLNFMSESAITSLEHSAERLGEEYQVGQVSDEELSELVSKIDEVTEFVLRGSLDSKLKEIAIDLLEALRGSVVEYRVRGLEGMEARIDEATGKLVRYYAVKTKAEAREPQDITHDDQVFEKLRSTVIIAEGILARALTYGPYLGSVIQGLLS